MLTSYASLPNKLVSAPNGVDYAYRDTGGGEGGVPLVLFQHFRGNLDLGSPRSVDALAPARRVVTVDYAASAARQARRRTDRRADGARPIRVRHRHAARPG